MIVQTTQDMAHYIIYGSPVVIILFKSLRKIRNFRDHVDLHIKQVGVVYNIKIAYCAFHGMALGI